MKEKKIVIKTKEYFLIITIDGNMYFDQGINLGGDLGLIIGINEKRNWQIKKKYYEWKNLNKCFSK